MITGSAADGETIDYHEAARRHLWLNFSRMGPYARGAEIPIIVRGDGCYVWDDRGNRYLDGLSSLFCTNIGHGRADIAQAGADQGATLGFFPIWSYAHPAAVELAAKIASLTPPGLDRVFFTSSGSEAVDSALKLARQYFKLTGRPNKTKVIARNLAYHGTTFGALSATGITGIREPFEPLPPGGCHVPNTNLYRPAPGYEADGLADAIADRIEFEGPATVSAVILEPVQNAGGCFTPPPGYFQRVREICDAYDVLLIADEVICSWGRLGDWFGAQRFDFRPDVITTGKGLTSAYAPLGAMIASDRLMEPFLEGDNSFMHGSTFSGHPVACAVALANISALERGARARERPEARAEPSARCSSRCATCRSSAMSAATGTSTRSSSSANGRRRRGSSAPRPSRWFAGWPLPASRPGSSAGPTAGGTRSCSLRRRSSPDPTSSRRSTMPSVRRSRRRRARRGRTHNLEATMNARRRKREPEVASSLRPRLASAYAASPTTRPTHAERWAVTAAMTTALLLGSLAALTWGGAALCSAPSSRLAGPWVPMLWGSLISVAAAALLALPSGAPSGSPADWGFVALAGAAYTAGLAFWLVAVNGGHLSLITPIVAADGAVAALLAAVTGTADLAFPLRFPSA